MVNVGTYSVRPMRAGPGQGLNISDSPLSGSSCSYSGKPGMSVH